MVEGDKARDYIYRCEKCGVFFVEDVVYPSDMVERHIAYIAIPEENELTLLKEDYPDDFPGDVQLSAVHKCEDGGFGIAKLVGCSDEYEYHEQ